MTLVSLFMLLGALALPQQSPGCIAAITTSADGTIYDGESVAFTDGTILNPATRFVGRTWSFGDGATIKSSDAAQTTVSHTYGNRTGRAESLHVTLTERTGLGTCSASLAISVSTTAI